MDTFLHEKSHTPDCILCGRCLEVCPLFAATGREELGPRAKHQIAAAMREGKLDRIPAKKLAALCLGCGRCEAACPQGLCAPDLVAAMRAAHPGLQEWLWRVWMQHGATTWPALARLGQFLPPGHAGGRLRSLAAMRASSRLRPWLRPLLLAVGGAAQDQDAPTVALFPGCLATHVRRDWTQTASRLLAAVGRETAPQPQWACCGCTLGHAGLAKEQHAAQEQNILAWREAGHPGVAVFCATCLCGLRAYARDLSLPWKPGEALLWQQSVMPLSGMLRELRFEVLEDAPVRVAYHRPCHGGGHKAGKSADQQLLEQALGEVLHVPKAGGCCGMGGVLQLGAPELSTTVAGRCWERLELPPGGQVLTGCSGCVLQLAATAPPSMTAGHWLDVLLP